MSNWQRLNSKIVYQNQWMTVHEDSVITPQGKPGIYGWVETPPAVYIVAIHDNGKVVLVNQERYTIGGASWELPGGRTDGQEPVVAAQHELAEEAGLHADTWAPLDGQYYVWNGLATQYNTVLIARGLHKARKVATDTDDFINTVQAYSWTELKAMMKSGELTDGESITALTLAGLRLGHFK